MINKFTTTILLTLSILSSVRADATKRGEQVDWSTDGTHPYDVHQYYDDIPDVINMTETRFWFAQVHWFITGVHRGLYDNETLHINPKCFGEYYVQKANEYAYTFQYDPFGNFIDNVFPEIYLSYMLFYMGTTECGLTHTFNDFSTYCWYRGCWPMQFIYKMGEGRKVGYKILLIIRAINDVAIAWKVGIEEITAKPDASHEWQRDEWSKLASATGMSIADIFQDVTDFYPLTEQEYFDPKKEAIEGDW